LSPLRIIDILMPGQWSGPVADHVTLGYDDRHRRRIVLTADHGTRILLDLEHSRVLPGGAGLKLADGRIVEVIAKPEDLLEVRAADGAALLRLAWHIGNRHLAAQVESGRILIRQDHVIAAMLAGLGATVSAVRAPFDPEGGAYGGAHQTYEHHDEDGHHHHDDHGHDHHGHAHAHEH
jgi:urease accessory protein